MENENTQQPDYPGIYINEINTFPADCGLGTTMTSDDLLIGFLNVTVKVAGCVTATTDNQLN